MTLILNDGTTVLLREDPHGWVATHAGRLIHLTITGPATATPSHARWEAAT